MQGGQPVFSISFGHGTSLWYHVQPYIEAQPAFPSTHSLSGGRASGEQNLIIYCHLV